MSKYHVTVISGSGSNDYSVGETVTITANPAPAAQAFDRWTTGNNNILIANYTNPNTTFTMVPDFVIVTATFKDLNPNEYSITVQNDGNGIANPNMTFAKPGTEITLNAIANPGYEFNRWKIIRGNISIDANNRFIMPATNVRIEALFRIEGSGNIFAETFETTLIAWTQNSTLYISGLIPGERWRVYTITGVLVAESGMQNAETEDASIQLPCSGIYIVKSGNRSLKVKN
jgi:hypothetical protein